MKSINYGDSTRTLAHRLLGLAAFGLLFGCQPEGGTKLGGAAWDISKRSDEDREALEVSADEDPAEGSDSALAADEAVAPDEAELGSAGMGGGEPPLPEPASQPGDGPAPLFLGDDSARCGDGVLDPDELCDVSIPEGREGACPMECEPFACREMLLAPRTCWTQCVLGPPLPSCE